MAFLFVFLRGLRMPLPGNIFHLDIMSQEDLHEVL